MAESNVNMKFTAQTADAQNKISGLNSVINKTTVTLATVAAAVTKVAQLASECINEYTTVERLNSRLEASWKNVGSATGMTASQLMDYADAIEKTTYMEAESVQSAAQLLAATQSLSEDGFKRALDLSVDLAEALGTDVSSAASTLAMALQDPESGLRRLRSAGVTFTEMEEDQITALVEANDLYSAQTIILDKVASKYEGIAKAVADTPANTLTQIQNTWGTIKEDIGSGLLNLITPALDTLYERLQEIQSLVSMWSDRTAMRTLTKTIYDDISQKIDQKNIDDLIGKAYSDSKYATDLSGYSNSDLDTAITYLQEMANSKLFQLAEATSGFDSSAYMIPLVLEAVKSERAGRPSSTSLTDITVAETTAVVESVTSTFQQTLTELRNSIDPNYRQASEYQSVIDAAEGLLTEMKPSVSSWADSGEPSNVYKSARDIGFSSPKEFIDTWKELSDVVSEYGGKIEELYNPIEEIASTPTAEDSALAILSSHGSMSATYQVDQLNEELEQVRNVIKEVQDPQLKSYLEEIEGGILSQITGLEALQGAAEETKMSLMDIASYALDAFSSVTNSLTSLWANEEENLTSALEKEKEAGTITAEEEEKKSKEINRLRKAQFVANQANSIASATMSGAQAMIKAFEEGGPTLGPVLAAVVGATTATQIATIAAQKYTPFAKGGIVTGPTHALIGEAGPEAVIPLNSRTAQKTLGGVTVVVNGNIYGDAEEQIFKAIERAQRIGELPKWSYA